MVVGIGVPNSEHPKHFAAPSKWFETTATLPDLEGDVHPVLIVRWDVADQPIVPRSKGDARLFDIAGVEL